MIWVLAALARSLPAPAQSNENVLVGSRPVGMGGAFTAVADDANALFYNPAGLQFLRQHQATFMNANLFGTGIRTAYACYALPISARQAMGLDWQHIGFGDGELGYNRDLIKFAFSRRWHPRLSTGVSVKYLLTNMSLDSKSVGKASGLGFDLGFLFTPIPRLRLGVNLYDLTGTRVRYDGRTSETILPRTIRPGVAYEARKNLLLALDVDRKLHLGGEYLLKNLLALRLGSQKDLKTSDPLELTFGLGVRYKAFRVDLSHAPGRRGLGQTRRYAFTTSFDPAASAVRIVGIEGQDLFASYYKTYEKAPVGRLMIQNKSDRSLECRLTVSISGYEDAPYQETLIVRKGDTPQAIPLRLSLSESVLKVSKDVAVAVEVKVEYATATRARSDKRTGKIVLYGRGALLWDQIGRAAAFVTSRDLEVAAFARTVSHACATAARVRRIEKNVLQAATVFEALGRFGVRYQVDANSPYAKVVSAEWPFDNIQYPRELLRQRTGDCDDCTVLYCAFLENLGIPTGAVDVPGHIFAVFDTGVDRSQLYQLGISEDRLLAFQGRLWVPVETTLLGKSFEEAWEAGLRQLRGRTDWQKRIQPISEAWLKYPPADPPFDFPLDHSLIAQACDSAAVLPQMEVLNRLKRAFVAQEYAPTLARGEGDPELHFDMAYDYASLNLLSDAKSAIYKAATLTKDTARIENFLGNICFLEGDLLSAVTRYRRAVDFDPADPGLRETLEMMMKRVSIASAPAPGAGERAGFRSEGMETEVELYWRK